MAVGPICVALAAVKTEVDVLACVFGDRHVGRLRQLVKEAVDVAYEARLEEQVR